MSPDTQTITDGIYPRPLEFGKGLCGKAGSAFQGSRLMFMTGSPEDRVIGRSGIAPEFPDTAVLQDLTDMDYARFNVALPRVLNVLLSTNQHPLRTYYLEGIPDVDIQTVLPTAIQVAKQAIRPEAKSGIVLRLVSGASEQPPFRALSYLLPAVFQMKALKTIDIRPPQLQVIIPTNIGSEMNGLDMERVRKQSIMFAQVARAFIQEFFPEVADRVVFLTDSPLEKGSNYRETLLQIARAITDQDIVTLEGKAAGRRSARTAKYYGAAHLIMHNTSASGVLQSMFDDQPPIVKPTGVINYGGLQERPFHELRRVLVDRSVIATIPQFQYFTAHHIPPYFMAEGDIALEDALHEGLSNMQQVPRVVREDMNLLENAVSPEGATLEEFLERVSSSIG